MNNKLKTMCVGALSAVMASAIADSPKPAESTRQTRIVATSVVLADVMTTNLTEVSRLMSPAAKKSWVDFAQSMVIDGNQYFLPDFFKVKYTFVGGVDDASFAMGLYNPFYDAFVLLRVNDSRRVPTIESFRVMTVSELRGKSDAPEFPPSAGTAPGERYFAVLWRQVRLAGDVFNARFLGADAPRRIAALDVSGESHEKLLTIAKARLGLLAKVVDDEKVKGQAVLSNAVIRDRRLADKPFVSTDKSTQRTVKTLATLPDGVRKSFALVSYFAEGGASNLIFYAPALPTLLIQARVQDNGHVCLKMFDAHVAGRKVVAGR